MTRLMSIGSPLKSAITLAMKLNPLKIRAMMSPSRTSLQAPVWRPISPITAYPSEAAPAKLMGRQPVGALTE